MKRRGDGDTLSLLTQHPRNLPREDRKSVGDHRLRCGIGPFRTGRALFWSLLSICEPCVLRDCGMF